MRGIHDFTEEQCIDELIANHREIISLQAREIRILDRFAQCCRDEHGVVDEFASAEVAAALVVTHHNAATRMTFARAMIDRLPATVDAMDRGELDRGKAEILQHYTSALTPDKTAAVETEMLQRVAGLTHGQWRAQTERMVLRIDPDGEWARHKEERRQRRIVSHKEPHGMATLSAYLPAQAATAIYAKVDRIAQQLDSDERTMDERRADVFTDLLLNPGAYADSTVQARVDVTVSANTLMGLDDKPGHLAGYGPIHAEVAREIAADATWRRLITDPDDGTLISCGTKRYKPPERMAEFIRARNQTCSFPGVRHEALSTISEVRDRRGCYVAS